MSDVVKWGLLAAAVVVAIGLIVALPFTGFIDGTQFATLLSRLTQICTTAFTAARGIINNFLTPFGRSVLTGLIYYLFGKFFVTLGIKITAWIYHYVFKG